MAPKKPTFTEYLQGLAKQFEEKSHAIRREQGWRSSEDVLALVKVMQLIHDKTANVAESDALAIIQSIHKVSGDVLGSGQGEASDE